MYCTLIIIHIHQLGWIKKRFGKRARRKFWVPFTQSTRSQIFGLKKSHNLFLFMIEIVAEVIILLKTTFMWNKSHYYKPSTSTLWEFLLQYRVFLPKILFFTFKRCLTKYLLLFLRKALHKSRLRESLEVKMFIT